MAFNMNSKKIIRVLTGYVQELPNFFEEIEQWCLESQVARPLAMQFVLMLDELLTNIAMHAYQGNGGWVEVTVQVISPMGLEARICDRGPVFDPTRSPPVDISADIEERKIGGLGVHFIQKLANEFTHQRVNDMNVVKIMKMEA